MTRSGHAAAVVLMCACACAAAAADTASDDRTLAYQSFREHFAARRFTDALPAAQKVLDLSEQQFGSEDLQLIVPLTNLATTQLRLEDYPSAERNYLRAVKIVETQDGGLSRRLLQPLLGLGATYYAAEQYQDSADALRRAVDSSRKLDGLFSEPQLELVEALIESYIALNMREDAEREQQYVVRLSETLYGRDNLQMLPTLDRVASWYEMAGKYRTARSIHGRALEIIRKGPGKNDLRSVNPLRGIARSYRQEFLYGTLEEDDGTRGGSPAFRATAVVSQAASQPDTRRSLLDPDGEEALKLALGVLRDHPQEVDLQAHTLLDLGDWYQIRGDSRNAVASYRKAWLAFSEPGGSGTQAMGTPVQLFYRPPSSATPKESTDERTVSERFVEVKFTVTRDGRVDDVRAVETDATEGQQKSVIIGVRRARYRPQFVAGNPVATPEMRIRQTLYVIGKADAES